jgi:hypothetical protein
MPVATSVTATRAAADGRSRTGEPRSRPSSRRSCRSEMKSACRNSMCRSCSRECFARSAWWAWSRQEPRRTGARRLSSWSGATRSGGRHRRRETTTEHRPSPTRPTRSTRSTSSPRGGVRSRSSLPRRGCGRTSGSRWSGATWTGRGEPSPCSVATRTACSPATRRPSGRGGASRSRSAGSTPSRDPAEARHAAPVPRREGRLRPARHLAQPRVVPGARRSGDREARIPRSRKTSSVVKSWSPIFP